MRAEKPPAAALEHAEYLASRPIFIGGPHKSGTTLLRNLMDGHGNLFVLPLDGKGLPWFEKRLENSTSREDFVAETARGMLYQLISPNYRLPPYFILTNEAPEWETYRRFVRYYSYLIDRNGRAPEGALTAAMQALFAVLKPDHADSYEYFVEKTTLNSVRSLQIIGRFPQAKFIHIERHPVSVLASQKQRQAMKRRRFDILAELEYLRQMKVHSERSRTALGARCFHKVQYEELVANTEDVMASVRQFLEIPHREALLSPTVNGIPASANTGRGDMRWPAGSVKPRDISDRPDGEHAEAAAVECYLDAAPRGTESARSRRGLPAFVGAIWKLQRSYRSNESCVQPSLLRAVYMWIRHKRLPAGLSRLTYSSR